MPNLKISIITCTYNSARNLRETLESVKKQTYQNFEHLFIDGCSTDNTLDIIKEYYDNPKLIVGKDKCLYDAFNKGLRNATGDVVGFLHSDDCFADEFCLERIAKAFENDVDYYCSRMAIYDEKLEKQFAILGAEPHRQSFKDWLYSSNYFAHPTYYVKKEVVEKVGEFNLDYKIAADIDWLYRLEKETSRYYFDNEVLVKFRGQGGASASNYFKGLKEEFVIRKKRDGLSFLLLIIYSYHFLRRLVRFVLEKLNLLFVVSFFRKIIFKFKK